MVALAEAARDGQLPGASIELVVCDRPGAPVLDHAQRLGLSSFAIDPSAFLYLRSFPSHAPRHTRARAASISIAMSANVKAMD